MSPPLVSGTRVHCVGELLTDVVARLPGVLAAGSDTRASVRLTGGGAAANVAAWLAELGVPVGLSARVGDDAAGRALADDLARHGVDVRGVERDPELPTGVCLVLLDEHGERTMVPDAGANVALSAVPVGPDDHLHVSAYALFHESVRPLLQATMTTALADGHTVSLDVGSAAPLRTVGADTVRAWCAGTLVLANHDEARVLTGRGDPGAAALDLAGWGRAAVVKAGADGAWCAQGDAVERVAVPVRIPASDTTGAGDAFAAGLLAALLAGNDLVAAARAAHTVAARALDRVGARP